MKSNQAKYRISTMCRTLGVSTSGYYAWLLRPLSARTQRDIALGDRVEAIHRHGRTWWVDGFVFIGKESNKLEAVEEGGVPSESDVYTVFNNPRREEWQTTILPIIRSAPVSAIMAATRMSRRAVQRVRNEDSAPRALHKNSLTKFAKAWIANQINC